MMKLLASATLVIASLLLSPAALAERPDFSKTVAAQSDYRFADNQPIKKNYIVQRTTRHDFSKTTAANRQYDFSYNNASPHCSDNAVSTQHDFSKTVAASRPS
ncbi:hypothetical protein [Shewanella colwelliana]|nr:hypothetical protein [Shewanella colwelliana]MDX1279955.1 hypothetical protein [Shewanella colwelliana]